MEDYIIEHTPDYNNPVLTVEDLVVKFNLRGQVLTAVRGISLELYKGESLAIVGESGSGKSVFTKTFMGLLDNNGWIDNGHIYYHDYDLTTFKKEKDWTKIRGQRIAMVFQDPMTSLNPVYTVGEQIAEVIRLHEKCSKEEAAKKAGEMLEMVGIPAERYNEYPHQFSGGMKQRVVIAMSIACSPQLILADEPTTALDVTIQAQVLELMNELKAKMNTSMLLITHDLGVVAQICDRVAIMYCGEIVEYGTIEEVFSHPAHPYTIGLFGSIPTLDEKSDHLNPIMGQVADPTDLPAGCCFNPRCPYAGDICRYEKPQRTIQNGTHAVCCHAAQGIFEQRELEEVIRIGRE